MGQGIGGISNSITNQAGYPSSGEDQAKKGLLPSQRASQPFGQQQNGGLGPAVGGQQYKTNAAPMSAGVASYAAIKPPTFQPPQPQQVPGMSGQPSYIVDPNANQGGQKDANAYQPGYRPQPQYQPPTLTTLKDDSFATKYGQLGDQPPTPSFGYQPGHRPDQGQQAGIRPNQYAYDAEQAAYGVGHYYDKGGAWDQQRQIEVAQQEDQQRRSAEAQSQLSGRGSDVAMLNSNYNNLLARSASEQQRALMQGQAMKDEIGIRRQQAEDFRNASSQMMVLASQLGLNPSEADVNAVTQDVLDKYGPGATPGQYLQSLRDHNAGVATMPEYVILNDAISSGNVQRIFEAVANGVNSQQLKGLLQKDPALAQKIWDTAMSHYDPASPNALTQLKSIHNALAAAGWKG